MSNQFFPTLHTSSWKMSRSPQWGTTVKTGVSGDRKRAPLQTHPRWKWTLKNGILQTAFNDLQAIQNLYIAMHGRLDWFLWRDPEGETIADPTQQINYLGTYYWPVAFTSDAMDFDRFAYQLWECGTCEFEQVSFPSSGPSSLPVLQAPNGLATSASVNVLTSHILGATYSGLAWAGVGPVFLNFGGLSSSSFMRDNSAWTLRTNTSGVSVSSNPYSTLIVFSIEGSLIGSTSPPDELRVYDVTLDVTYEDGTIGTLRPTSAITIPDGQGTITNAANAIDGDPSTYASVTRSVFGPGTQTSPLLEVTHFV